MMDFLEKSRMKLVHLVFPFVERFRLVIAVVLVVSVLLAWSVPQTYWQIRSFLFWLIVVNNEVNWAGTIERDYLPLQPGSSAFYHIYRFANGIYFLFFLIWLLFILVPVTVWIARILAGLFIVVTIIRAVGDHKYRPKKPEE